MIDKQIMQFFEHCAADLDEEQKTSALQCLNNINNNIANFAAFGGLHSCQIVALVVELAQRNVLDK